MRDTIFALSSGMPPAAIAIVRISGPSAGDAIRALGATLPAPRRTTLVALRDGSGALLDRALLIWLPGPRSATGEDVAELNLHGGRATIAAVLAALAACPGLRAAEPGEFTRRAFENGRIDLAQAEGLGDLLFAETEAQRRNALRMAEGGLGALVEQWRAALLGLAARVEAEIEFGDEDGDIAGPSIRPDLDRLQAAIVAALETPPAERLRDGPRIVVAGPPNAGKSSLINAIAGRPVAIATPIPGTTRDLIEVPLILAGLPCILIDSAGLRDASDEIEAIGVARARSAIDGADLILWLGPMGDRPTGNVVVIAAQCDVLSPNPEADIATSAKTGEGLGDLRALLAARIGALLPDDNRLALRERQRGILARIAAELDQARALADPVLIAEHLALARTGFDHIVGRAGVEDMLDDLFGRFCIGK